MSPSFLVNFWFGKFRRSQTMSKMCNTEFKKALREIAQRMPHFNSPYDRVRIVEWSRRLAGVLEDTIDESRKRNDYVQLLKIMTRGGRLHGIFRKKPPDNEIPPLSEAIVNALCEKCPYLPKPGPIEPVVSRQTPDGCAYIAFRKLPNKGILCYMAVTPEGFSASDTSSRECMYNGEVESDEGEGEDCDVEDLHKDVSEDVSEDVPEDDRKARFILSSN